MYGHARAGRCTYVGMDRRSHCLRDDEAAIGRPTAAGLESLRDVSFTLRLRRDELAEWRAHAAATGWTLSALIRDAMRRRVHG